ncbi:hypothetical protein HRJ35_00585 [Shewanella oneidensis MR-1]|uniref:Predicted membrane protein n=1 Tax=Shewanella oneidensis (strain ATCC 700550 / JCM 31522 / CIP 106686 / LMG 19005 / NCIMB 14063 / MR-1) TaxID=211586 RepID=Q8E9F3_SHEON|nr:hypothetical protein [Shewanella oneidensis]AAN57299.1 predicted membrane protein [Shewanella oneidensis MR-1]MDX5998390.1 hypothetical protein [Shewanella oneidensis]MEE2027168.1 hypothetical protein [Shewanella oneidensis]QKG94648.1 hypothetical protein HRJ35_00585 [Shewanella oneidensis MR-1]
MDIAISTHYQDYLLWGLLLLGGLPLLSYPFVLLASLMGLAGQSKVKVHWFYWLMNKSFLWGTIAYPVVYLPCYWLARGGNSPAIFLYAAIPLVYLLILYLCFHRMDAPLNRKNTDSTD